MSESAITFVHVPEQQRYEIRDGGADGVLVGFTEYLVPDEAHFDFVHTEVSPEYGGQGLGSGIVEFALTDARRLGKRIIAHCPLTRGWLAKHPGVFDDIVDPAPGID